MKKSQVAQRCNGDNDDIKKQEQLHGKRGKDDDADGGTAFETGIGKPSWCMSKERGGEAKIPGPTSAKEGEEANIVVAETENEASSPGPEEKKEEAGNPGPAEAKKGFGWTKLQADHRDHQRHVG